MIELLVNLESPTTMPPTATFPLPLALRMGSSAGIGSVAKTSKPKGHPMLTLQVHFVILYEECIYHTLEHDLVKISSYSVLMSGFQMYSHSWYVFEMPAFQNEMISDSQRSQAYKLNTSQWWRWPWTVASFWSMLEDLWTISVTLRARFKDKNPNQGPVKSPGDSSIFPLTCPENSWIFFGPQSFYTDPKGHTTSEMQTIKFIMK